jgi:sulfite exporter TauE/SafE
MHCSACTILTESEAKNLPYITAAQSSLGNQTIKLVGDFSNRTPEAIAQDLSATLGKHGYAVSLSLEKQLVSRKWSDFKVAVPLALAFAVLFLLLQKLGVVNLVNTGYVSYGTVFVIGVIASLSTCMAVVGGLVLSMSATFAKEGDKIRPQLLFHAGRLVSFFILGGIIGAAGAVFTLSTTATFALGIVIAFVMFVLGVNLLDVFRWPKRLQPSIPKFLSRYAIGVSNLNHSLTPFLVGVVTFFLPCGFTQAMQIYTLSAGSFIGGALTMSVFALGTLPVLALVSFSSFSVKKSAHAGVFFKTAGLIVILFAVFNVINNLVIMGLIRPVFSF